MSRAGGALDLDRLGRLEPIAMAQVALWAVLGAALYEILTLYDHGLLSGDKAATVSVLGHLLPTAVMESRSVYLLSRVVFVIACLLWAVNRCLPWSAWVATLAHTLHVSIYFEQIPYWDHKVQLIGSLLIPFCLWAHFHGRAIEQARRAGTVWSEPLAPRWLIWIGTIHVALFYGYAGITKLIWGGWQLFDGLTFQLYVYRMGRPHGWIGQLIVQHRWLAQVGIICATALELSALVALISRRWRVICGLILISFHVVNEFLFVGFLFRSNIVALLIFFVVCPLWQMRLERSAAEAEAA